MKKIQMRLLLKMVKNLTRSSIVAGQIPITTQTKQTLTYEDAIYVLNGLQSNASVLEKARKERSINAHKNILNTEKFLKRLCISPSDLDRLNIIHISGTKGKGSTCAFTESILRHHGLKTGFYSSPHLVVVRERIRINGQPLSREAFTSYFWDVYNLLKQQQVKDEEVSMPPYFMFLTVMAFHVFLQEKVDVAVIEVGVGGLYDNTNVIRSPSVVGVTSLGFDHVAVLGQTIEEIALQKAGIFKSGVTAFTVSQPDEAMKVLQKKAFEVNCPLYVVPPLVTYNWEKLVRLGIPGDIQSLNASLALQLCKRWIINQETKFSNKSSSTSVSIHSHQLPLPLAVPFLIDKTFADGLLNCVWPGRCQTIHRGKTTYFLDGAHTAESIEQCLKWYSESIKKEQISKGNVYRILLFNCTGERKAESLLAPLINQHFDLVMFSPNSIYTIKDATSDQSNFTVDPGKEIRQCEINLKIWNHLISSVYEEEISSNAMINSSCTFSFPLMNKKESHTVMFSCLMDALQWISHNHDCDLKNKIMPKEYSLSIPEGLLKSEHISVLITGSIHLVGNVLSLIDPELSSAQKSIKYL